MWRQRAWRTPPGCDARPRAARPDGRCDTGGWQAACGRGSSRLPLVSRSLPPQAIPPTQNHWLSGQRRALQPLARPHAPAGWLPLSRGAAELGWCSPAKAQAGGCFGRRHQHGRRSRDEAD